MTWLDRLLQRWRIRKALRYVRGTPRILDIGCGNGELLRAVADRATLAVGIDPDVSHGASVRNARLIRGRFPADLPDVGPFDVITCLATLEHLQPEDQEHLAAGCATLLVNGGVMIASVPSGWVDPILHALRRLRLIDGLALHEHHGFDVRNTPALFSKAGLECVGWTRFQLGLNNLFVFRKP